jgi:RNA polymerase sigma-70 factor (ECF subfamily)
METSRCEVTESPVSPDVAGDAPIECEESLAAVYRRSYTQLRAVAVRLVSHQDADDLVHEAFVRALRAQHQFRRDAAPATWLHRIVVNACLDARYRDRRQKRRGIAVPLLEARDLASPPPRPLESRAVRRALRALSDREQAVCILHDIVGFTHAEIAIALGIPAGTSKCRLMVARRRLRALLGEPRDDAAPASGAC